MRQHLVQAGVAAGIVAGIVSGTMMQIMLTPTLDGGRLSLMTIVAIATGTDASIVGWVLHLFFGALLGGLFGRVLGDVVEGADCGLCWGALYGTAFWLVVGLTLLPLSLGLPPLAPATLPGLWPLAMSTFIASLFYGLTLGVTFGWWREELRSLSRGPIRARPA
jgi:hypothetical protein